MPAGAIEVRVDTIIKVTEPANTIVLPILERGEIYIRFGEPGSVPLVTTLRPQGEPLRSAQRGRQLPPWRTSVA